MSKPNISITNFQNKGIVDIRDVRKGEKFYDNQQVTSNGLYIDGIRIVPRLGENDRDIIRLLVTKMDWSIEQISGLMPAYSEDALVKIIRQPVSSEFGIKKTQALSRNDQAEDRHKPGKIRYCKCGCGRQVRARKQYARKYCHRRKKFGE
jgi:hypothetical protein